MADLDPPARSPLSHLAAAPNNGIGGASVRLRERPFRGFIDLRVDASDVAARAAAETALGAALPQPNRVTQGTACTVAWLGPDEFLAMTEPDREVPLAAALRQALAAHHASVVEVSDGRTIFEVTGPQARDLIAKGCGLDLHPRVFAPGQCAQSGLAKARILLRQLDDAPTFELVAERSHAEYLWLWLEDALREFAG